jgi:hypothetical protein
MLRTDLVCSTQQVSGIACLAGSVRLQADVLRRTLWRNQLRADREPLAFGERCA